MEPLTWLALVLSFVIVAVWGAALYFLVGAPVRHGNVRTNLH